MGVDCEERCLRKSRRMIALLVFALFICGFSTKSFAAETSSSGYQSRGTTSFYGTYEQDEGQEDGAGGQNGNGSGGNASGGYASGGSSSTLPGYQGKGNIIPQTGDTSELSYQLVGLGSLSLVALLLFETKRKENRGVH